jgi:hypothetical protein
LNNAQHDGQDMADMLECFQFEVTLRINADLTLMRRSVREFVLKVKGNRPCTALLYFAGHGVEVKGRNFLIPVDFRALEDPNDEMGDVALELNGDVYGKLNAPGTRHRESLNIIVLDCCRESETHPDATFRHLAYSTRNLSGENGLFRTGAPPISAPNSSQFVTAYGAAPGNVTMEFPSDRNGVFTGAILEELRGQGADETLQDLLLNVTSRVSRRTGGKQELGRITAI